ncbi:MAG: hypothetical protein AB7O24_23515 [Kofleriaceae bacterium]
MNQTLAREPDTRRFAVARAVMRDVYQRDLVTIFGDVVVPEPRSEKPAEPTSPDDYDDFDEQWWAAQERQALDVMDTIAYERATEACQRGDIRSPDDWDPDDEDDNTRDVYNAMLDRAYAARQRAAMLRDARLCRAAIRARALARVGRRVHCRAVVRVRVTGQRARRTRTVTKVACSSSGGDSDPEPERQRASRSSAGGAL